MKLVVVVFLSLLTIGLLQYNESAAARECLWRSLSPHYRSYNDYKQISLPKLVESKGLSENNVQYFTTDFGYYFR